MLSALGLDEVQESAYRALVRLGSVEVPALARLLTRAEADTEQALHQLERQGLAARSSGPARRWFAVPPNTALGTLLTQRRDELARAEQAAAALADAYRSGCATGADAPDVVEIACGAGAIGRRAQQLLAAADDELCALIPGTERLPVGGPARYGVRHRVVLERALLARPTALGELCAALGAGYGAQIRVVDRLPTTLLAADGRLALVTLERPTRTEPAAGPAVCPGTGPYDTSRAPAARWSADERPDGARPGAQERAVGEPDALVVRPSGLLVALLTLFETVWREAVPLRLDTPGDAPTAPPAEPGCPDPTDLDILSLLLAGLTDASVAKHLDLGLRTVQRRVKGLMDLAGVTTRLQLGWHAYEHRWLPRPAGAPGTGDTGTTSGPDSAPAPHRAPPAVPRPRRRPQADAPGPAAYAPVPTAPQPAEAPRPGPTRG
ncbi:helix-turn-helix domain-containing protein, partial [Streptomyces sp. 796.1]|uniref:helix-turn-helix domain-containing protein n=1 Tax=Streptomyces sp. 796.1 TaxID=3163029 RepID=UPI0039C93F64